MSQTAPVASWPWPQTSLEPSPATTQVMDPREQLLGAAFRRLAILPRALP